MYLTHEADLDLPSLPPAVRRVHIVPALQTASLLSMGQLCNAGCRVTFDPRNVHVHNTIFYSDLRHSSRSQSTYLRVVSALRPEKANPYRVRWTVGGDKVDYPFEVSTKTADLTTTKLLINSVVSTPNAKFLTADLKDFYLGTPMERYEYMRVPICLDAPRRHH